MIKDWLSERRENGYWLANSSTHTDAVKERGFGFEDSIPLFVGELFSEVKDLSPWIIPVSEEVLALEEETLQRGIGLCSSENTEAVLAHLRSLLTASLEGEEVMFRFYDPNVVLPMLEAMDEGERSSFLGNLTAMAVTNDALTVFSNTPKPEFQPNTDIWWKIQPHHLAELYSLGAHAYAIERRWWELFPELMEKTDSPAALISGALQKAIDAGCQQQAEYYVMVDAAQQTGIHISEFSIPFHLTFEELKMLQAIKESGV
ncbi:DUF4123 domain-containing protein [Vibrio sp. JPW-9-11-11]|nr:DUF4123 domain-containing protein [Vibrio sp. JPW-9-11-11]